MLEIRDPIMTHSTLGGVMEWVTAEDAARLLVNACDPDVPAQFWGGIHNIGGGEQWRLTNWQLQTMISGAMGVGDVRKWYDRNWFATRNFHGQWYTDSDRLEALVPFRRDTPKEALARAVATLPRAVRSAGLIPPAIVKHLVLKPLAYKPRGTMDYIRRGDDAGVSAFFGSREEWEAIGDLVDVLAAAPRPLAATPRPRVRRVQASLGMGLARLRRSGGVPWRRVALDGC